MLARATVEGLVGSALCAAGNESGVYEVLQHPGSKNFGVSE